MKDRSEKTFLIAMAMISAGLATTVLCIGTIHGAIYGWLTLGICLVLSGAWVGLAPGEGK